MQVTRPSQPTFERDVAARSKEDVTRILAASMEHVRKGVAAMSDADLAAPVELCGRAVASWASFCNSSPT